MLNVDSNWKIANATGAVPAPPAAPGPNTVLQETTESMQQFWTKPVAFTPISTRSIDIDIFDVPELRDLPAPVRYLTLCGEQMQSKSHWQYGSGVGSQSQWKYGSGPGSESQWKYGSGTGSESQWKYGSGPGSESQWKYGSGAGSESFWKYGSGPGSESHWNYGSGPGSKSNWEYGS